MSKNTDNYLELLGMTGRDKVTGFSGVVVTVSFDLFGCVQVVLSPPVDKDGKRVEGCWFDVNRIELDASKERAMKVPMFGAVPREHDHGPAEKPAGGVK